MKFYITIDTKTPTTAEQEVARVATREAMQAVRKAFKAAGVEISEMYADNEI